MCQGATLDVSTDGHLLDLSFLKGKKVMMIMMIDDVGK